MAVSFQSSDEERPTTVQVEVEENKTGESREATIRFSNGSAIVCEKKAKNPWSMHFFELPEPRMEYEVDESIIKGKKIGRNDPCPCGSGKKYKQCCGRNA